MRRILLLLVVVGFLGTGCTALKTFPQAARGGDTIALAVGSPDGMTRANTTATFTSDSDGIPIDITANIRSIFKLYADKASSIYAKFSATDSIVDTSGHEPWITVVALDLPTGLTTGPGQIQFNTPAAYPTIGSHINDFPIALEILPGTGAPSDFTYELGVGGQLGGDLATLETQEHAIAGPQFPSPSCPCPDYGAIEIKIHMPNSFGTGLTQDWIRVLVDDLTGQTGSGRGVNYGLSLGEDLTVIITSPTGQLKYYEARFSIVAHPAVIFNGAPTITSVRYFDVNGNETTGPVSDYLVSLQ
jgi:hypothetical protein